MLRALVDTQDERRDFGMVIKTMFVSTAFIGPEIQRVLQKIGDALQHSTNSASFGWLSTNLYRVYDGRRGSTRDLCGYERMHLYTRTCYLQRT